MHCGQLCELRNECSWVDIRASQTTTIDAGFACDAKHCEARESDPMRSTEVQGASGPVPVLFAAQISSLSGLIQQLEHCKCPSNRVISGIGRFIKGSSSSAMFRSFEQGLSVGAGSSSSASYSAKRSPWASIMPLEVAGQWQ